MLISTPDELRLYSPSNAIDHIDTLSGFLDSSEHDFLAEKLGTKLHASLVEYYRNLVDTTDGIQTFLDSVTHGKELLPYARLLTLAQRVVIFDALGRAIDMQAISVNGSGINISTADDYGKADRETVVAYKTTCVKEAHAAINRLLVVLEEWTQECATLSSETSDNSETSEERSVLGDSVADKSEIVSLWASSRYFYLAAGLAIPSATVLQEYLNIYDSREKYITMLPDLRYIQEDIIAPIIGEDFLDYLIDYARTTLGSVPALSSSVSGDAIAETSEEEETALTSAEKRLLNRTIHRLRKAVARHLESRTMQVKVGDARRETAHNEAVKLTTDLSDYITAHQSNLPAAALEAFQTSPLYTASTDSSDSDYTPSFENNSSSAVMFVTPALN